MSEPTKTPCPRCGQDWLQQVVILATMLQVTACPECDATWFPPGVPGQDPFVMLHVYLDEQGLAYEDAVRAVCP